MTNAISRESSLIRNATNALTSFCTKHPLLTLITTVAFGVFVVIRLIQRNDTRLEQAFEECLKNNKMKRAEALAPQIFSNRIRDTVYERLSKAYRRTFDTLNAELNANKITNPDLKKKTLQEIRIR